MDCILCGKCKKSCPAYTVYREEQYSPRGKMALHYSRVDNGDVDFICYFCGNCVSSCPFDIDVPVEFLFDAIRVSDSTSTGFKVLVDTINLATEVIETLKQSSSKHFDEVHVIGDGVNELNTTNNRDVIDAFFQFLTEHRGDELYFVERSAFEVANRLGHTRSYRLSKSIDMDISEIPKQFTRYYEVLSEDQLAKIDCSAVMSCSGYTDVAYSFGNDKLIFYTDAL